LDKANLSEDMRKVALAFDNALENRDRQAILEKFTEDCEIELLSIKLNGKEGAEKWLDWLYEHIVEITFTPVTIMVEGNKFFEEYVVEAKFHDGKTARSNQAVVLVFENLKIKSLRLYFDRLDFSNAVAKDVLSKTIFKELAKKSLEGLV
jgi:ketosteroid isomerase-like protein